MPFYYEQLAACNQEMSQVQEMKAQCESLRSGTAMRSCDISSFAKTVNSLVMLEDAGGFQSQAEKMMEPVTQAIESVIAACDSAMAALQLNAAEYERLNAAEGLRLEQMEAERMALLTKRDE